MNNNGRIKSIQFLRAVAVILIVYRHIPDIRPPDNYTISWAWFLIHLQSLASIGVDMFFVISGFIIIIIVNRYAQNQGGFYFFTKRLLRVVPLYWMVSLLAGIFMYKHNIRFEKAVLLKTLVIFPFLDKTNFVYPVLQQGWTLSFELFFYVVIAIGIGVNKVKYLLFTFLFFFGAVVLNYATGNENKLLIFAGNGIMIEFLLGAAIGIIFSSGFVINPIIIKMLFLTGITGLVTNLFSDNQEQLTRAGYTTSGVISPLRVLVWGLPSALILLGLVLHEKMQKIKIYSFWIAIGDASYSIYLTHIFFMQPVYTRFNNWGIVHTIPSDVATIIIMATAISAGYVFYKVVEQPFLRLLNYFLSKYKKPGNHLI